MMIDRKNPASFRDPSGFLFDYQGELYRQINHSYKEEYDFLLESGLYQKLIQSSLLIPHEEVQLKEAGDRESYKMIKPRMLPFISYPYEWSFSQLQDAALATLRIQKIAMEHGLSLKDASAYNIQFYEGRPILIDTLSFEKYQEGSPWIAYRQFCQHFLAPLVLMSRRDVRLAQLLRIYVDGIPLDLAAKLLPLSSWFNFGLAMHIHFHAKSQKHFSDKQIKNESKAFSKFAFLGLIDSLENCVKGLRWNPQGTEWGGYYQATNYTDRASEHKKNLVASFLDQIRPVKVLDLGANTGLYSRIASERGIPTVASDIDPAAVEINYQECRKKNEKNLLPLLLDLTNPSSGLGWANEERMSFTDRGPVDTVLALALIHHLAISNNLPLAKIAAYFSLLSRFLIIEFIPKSDSQVQKLLRSRKDIFPSYHQQAFEEEFSAYFDVREAVKIRDSERMLYWMKKKE